MSMLSPLKIALVAAVADVSAASAPALAQDYGPPYAYSAPPEDVIVVAPRHIERFREEGSGARLVTLPPEKVSLSSQVPYDDLDLTSWEGARELRWRVREAARRVCGELRDTYELRQLPGTSCIKDATENGLIRADEAITTARQDHYYGYTD